MGVKGLKVGRFPKLPNDDQSRARSRPPNGKPFLCFIQQSLALCFGRNRSVSPNVPRAPLE